MEVCTDSGTIFSPWVSNVAVNLTPNSLLIEDKVHSFLNYDNSTIYCNKTSKIKYKNMMAKESVMVCLQLTKVHCESCTRVKGILAQSHSKT